MKTPRITFKKGSTHSGLMRFANTYRVNYLGNEIAVIQETAGGSWFWYGDGINTAHHPRSLDECKRDVKTHFASKLIIPNAPQ